jgi:two-component system, chemotaxis family, protein-glutamate methylesterase/glutaminase
MHQLFLIDQAAIGRLDLHQCLAAAGFKITGTAGDPHAAWPRLQGHWPDAIVLDLDGPLLDIPAFLQRLCAARPTPVVLCATQRGRTDPTVRQALAAGATAFVHRSTANGAALVAAVRDAMHVPAPAPASPRRPATGRPSRRVVAIGLSTGGVQSIDAVLGQLGRDAPGIVLVQHMPEKFTASFAARLNSQYALEVLEARDGDVVYDGRVLIAPGGKQMRLRRQGSGYAVEIRDDPPVRHHRPSVDVLFSSVARCAGRDALGVLMTGMGRDGAQGLLEMHAAGAPTAAQDEASSIVFGMPAEAIRLGAADDVLALDQIAEWILTTGRIPGRARTKTVAR